MDPKPLPPPQSAEIQTKVPWDPAELQGRECQHCACYFESVNPDDPKKFQGFCRRTPGQLTQARVLVPRRDRDGRPVLKDGVPVMNNEVVDGFLYQVTLRNGTCFDGYRPKGTLPGETTYQAAFRSALPGLISTPGFPPAAAEAIRKAFDLPTSTN